MARTPEVGEAAPDFTLPGVALADGQAVRGEYTLSGLRGAPVVLAFYPCDDTLVGFPLLADVDLAVTGRTASAWGAARCAGRFSSWTARARCGGST